MSTQLATTVRQPSQPPRRQNTFSTTIRPRNSHSGAQTSAVARWSLPSAMASTKSFMPYCTATAQIAALITSVASPPKCQGRWQM